MSQSDFLSSDYLVGVKSASELVKRLKSVSKYLSGREQDSPGSPLTAVAAALVPLLESAHADVRLLVACCVADIIRIYAPDAPYDDATLKRIFALFVAQLRDGLADPEGVAFKRTFYLLERLALVKAFVLLVELDARLSRDLFLAFFGLVSDAHSNSVITHILDILVACVDEMEHIPVDILDAILRPLTSPHKKDNPAAYRLAQNLVNRCVPALQASIGALLNGAIEGDARGLAAQSSLRSDYHELVFEINKINAQLLLGVLPNLEKELVVDQKETRVLAVQLLARMFAAKRSTLARQYRPLFSAFMHRFSDREEQVRLAACQFARHLLTNLEDDDDASAVATDLRDRLRDLSEAVRLAAVKAVVDAAAVRPDRVPGQLLAEVALRARDRRQPIREAALKGLASLYAAAQLDENKSASSSGPPEWLATTLVKASMTHGDATLVERLLIDMVGGGPKSAENPNLGLQADELVALYIALDDDGKTALDALFLKKMQFRTQLGLFLESADETRALAFLAKQLELEAEDDLVRLRRQKSAAAELRRLLAPVASRAEIHKATATLRASLPRSAPLGALARDVATRTSMGLLPADVATVLISRLPDATRARREAILSLLGIVAERFPDILATADALERMSDMLASQQTAVLPLLAAVARCAPEALPRAVSKTLTDRLFAIVQDEEDVTSVRHAATAMCHLARALDQAAVLDRLATAVANANNPQTLMASASIAQHATVTFVEHGKETMKNAMGFIRSSNTDGCGEASLHLIAAYLSARARPDVAMGGAEAAMLDTLLFPMTGENVAFDYNDARRTPFDALRVTAVELALPLFCHKVIDDRLSVAQWRNIGALLRHPDTALRTRVLTALRNGLAIRTPGLLPLRFMGLLAAVGSDPDKAIRDSARAAIQRATALRVLYAKRTALPPAEKAALLPEYALPFAAAALANTQQTRREADAHPVDPVGTGRDVDFFVSALLSAHNDFSFAHRIAAAVAHSRNIADPDANTRPQLVAELAIIAVRQRSDKASNWKLSSVAHQELFLPSALYELASDPPPRILPTDYRVQSNAATTMLSPTKNKTPAKKTPTKKRATPTRVTPKRSAKRGLVSDVEDDESASAEEAPVYADSDDSGDAESGPESDISSPTKRQKKPEVRTPAKRTRTPTRKSATKNDENVISQRRRHSLRSSLSPR